MAVSPSENRLVGKGPDLRGVRVEPPSESRSDENGESREAHA